MPLASMLSHSPTPTPIPAREPWGFPLFRATCMRRSGTSCRGLEREEDLCVCVCVCRMNLAGRLPRCVRPGTLFLRLLHGGFCPPHFSGGLQRYNRVGSFGGDLINLTTRPHTYILWCLDTCIVRMHLTSRGERISVRKDSSE